MRRPIKNIFTLIAFFMGIHSGISQDMADKDKNNHEAAIFASGCFWCTEAIFQELEGVKEAVSGYTGGHVKNPSYREVCNETTGHAEAVKVTFDPDMISFEELLEIFFKTHDPTTLNRQGADVGTQYRSAVFYLDNDQKEATENIIRELDASGAWDKPIVTEVSPAGEFYVAEDYHQDYFYNNPSAAYCNFVIVPKMEKFRKVFSDKLKQK
jgi:peptide-methionine (S)-S-oxide reductase